MTDGVIGKHRYYVILKNDDVHTFDEVIRSLVRFCAKSRIDAMNAAIAVHTSEFAAVYCGDIQGARHISTALRGAGLSASIVSEPRYGILMLKSFQRPPLNSFTPYRPRYRS